MTDTLWRTRSPKQSIRQTMIKANELSPDRCGALLINPSGRPDWVRDPEGHKVAVEAVWSLQSPRKCALCGLDLPVGTEVLVAKCHDAPEFRWFVYSCKTLESFAWERRRIDD